MAVPDGVSMGGSERMISSPRDRPSRRAAPPKTMRPFDRATCGRRFRPTLCRNHVGFAQPAKRLGSRVFDKSAPKLRR